MNNTIDRMRRLKIKSIERTLTEEKRKKIIAAAAYGVGFTAMLATVLSYGKIDEPMVTAITNLSNSGAGISVFVASIAAQIASTFQFFKHKEKQREAQNNLDDFKEFFPEDFINSDDDKKVIR